MFTVGEKSRSLALLFACLPLFLGAGNGQAQDTPQAAAFTVDGKVALASLIALSDGYLIKLADSLQLLAASPEAQSADWRKIREPLARAGEVNVPALNWFALPDGSYWSVQEGKARGNLAERAYFPKVLAGKTVIGDLLVSTATGRSMAIVAVPVMRPDKTVVGVLGASVYLDRLSTRLEREMGLDNTMIFYSFDAQPLKGLNWDPGLIFRDPTKLPGQEDFSRAVKDMMTKSHGTERYVFRGRQRTVLFRRSAVTGWWYVFGVVPEGREEKGRLEQRE
jgi:hypothetical protein